MFLHVVRCVGPENLPPEERKEVKDVVAVPKPPALWVARLLNFRFCTSVKYDFHPFLCLNHHSSPRRKPEKNLEINPLTEFGPRQNIITAEGAVQGKYNVVIDPPNTTACVSCEIFELNEPISQASLEQWWLEETCRRLLQQSNLLRALFYHR